MFYSRFKKIEEELDGNEYCDGGVSYYIAFDPVPMTGLDPGVLKELRRLSNNRPRLCVYKTDTEKGD